MVNQPISDHMARVKFDELLADSGDDPELQHAMDYNREAILTAIQNGEDPDIPEQYQNLNFGRLSGPPISSPSGKGCANKTLASSSSCSLCCEDIIFSGIDLVQTLVWILRFPRLNKRSVKYALRIADENGKQLRREWKARILKLLDDAFHKDVEISLWHRSVAVARFVSGLINLSGVRTWLRAIRAGLLVRWWRWVIMGIQLATQIAAWFFSGMVAFAAEIAAWALDWTFVFEDIAALVESCR